MPARGPWLARRSLPQVELQKNKGLCRGDKFQLWLHNKLESLGAKSLGSLKTKCSLDGIPINLVGRANPCRDGSRGLAGQTHAWPQHPAARMHPSALRAPATPFPQMDTGSVSPRYDSGSSPRSPFEAIDSRGVTGCPPGGPAHFSPHASGAMKTQDRSTKLEVNPEAVLVIVAADVTTSTKAALSWARPKPCDNMQRAGSCQTGGSSDDSPRIPPLMDNVNTISELYWKDPGEVMCVCVCRKGGGGGWERGWWGPRSLFLCGLASGSRP